VLERRQEYEKMALVEMEHWWYRSLHRLVLDAVQAHFTSKEIDLIDAGCGTGGLMLFLRDHGYRNLSGFDLSPHAVRIARRRGLDVVQDDLLSICTRSSPGVANVIVSNDTFYFLDRDQQFRFVALCGRVLRPAGLLIANLPALDAFRGIHDLSVGTRKRFSRADVRELFCRDPYETVVELYWPFLLSPLIYMVRLAQRLRLKLGQAVDVRSDIDLPRPRLNHFFESVTGLENSRMRSKPFGSSLFVVARKQA